MPYAIIDPAIPYEAKMNLKGAGFELIDSPATVRVDTPVRHHPDLQMFLHKDNLFAHPDIDRSFLKKIDNRLNIIVCEKNLTKEYPGDIPYNIACVGNHALTHKKNQPDQNILDYLKTENICILATNQGYCKCSTLIVDDKSIITSDISINSAAVEAGIDTLLITHGYIDLPGYNYGFIGGASGRFDDTIYITGSIEHHPDCGRIYDFITSRNMKLRILSTQRVYDGGTIFFLE